MRKEDGLRPFDKHRPLARVGVPQAGGGANGPCGLQCGRGPFRSLTHRPTHPPTHPTAPPTHPPRDCWCFKGALTEGLKYRRGFKIPCLAYRTTKSRIIPLVRKAASCPGWLQVEDEQDHDPGRRAAGDLEEEEEEDEEEDEQEDGEEDVGEEVERPTRPPAL